MPVTLPGNQKEIAVAAAFYDSLELGDIVGVMKSSSLAAILEVQRRIYECPVVCDAYTYCGLDGKLFNEAWDEAEKLLSGREPPLKETCMDYVSTGFSVKDAHIADSFLGRSPSKKADTFL